MNVFPEPFGRSRCARRLQHEISSKIGRTEKRGFRGEEGRAVFGTRCFEAGWSVRRDAGRRVTRLAVCPLYTDNWATLAMAGAWLAKARDPTEVITCLFPAPEPAQRTRTEQVMCPDTAPPARARAGRTASCARLCTLWPLPLPHTGEDVHASDRPHTPRHRVRTLPLEPLVSFPTHTP